MISRLLPGLRCKFRKDRARRHASTTTGRRQPRANSTFLDPTLMPGAQITNPEGRAGPRVACGPQMRPKRHVA